MVIPDISLLVTTFSRQSGPLQGTASNKRGIPSARTRRPGELAGPTLAGLWLFRLCAPVSCGR